MNNEANNIPDTAEATVWDFRTNYYGNPIAHYMIVWKGPKHGRLQSKRRADTGYHNSRSDAVITALEKRFKGTRWDVATYDTTGMHADVSMVLKRVKE